MDAAGNEPVTKRPKRLGGALRIPRHATFFPKAFPDPVEMSPGLIDHSRRLPIRAPREEVQLIVVGMPDAVAHEDLRQTGQVFDWIPALWCAIELREELLEIQSENLIQETILVPEILVDRGCRIAAALDQAADGERPLSAFGKEGIAGVEDHAPRFRTTLASALLLGLGTHGEGIQDPWARIERRSR